MLIFSSKGRVKHGSTPLLAVVGIVLSAGGDASVSVPSTTVTYGKPLPTVTATASVAVPSTTAQFAAHAPTVAASASATVSVHSTTATYTKHLPTLTATATAAVPSSTAQFTASLPTLAASSLASVPSTGISVSDHVPTITATASVSAPSTTAQFTAHLPEITAFSGSVVMVPSTTARLTASLPTITGNLAATVSVPATAWTASASLPVVSADATATVGATDWTATPHNPTATGNSAGAVNVPATGLTFTAHLPSVYDASAATVGVPATALTVTAHKPTINDSETLDVPSTTLSITAHLPALTADAAATIPATGWTLTAHLPTLTADAIASVPSTSVTVTASSPTVAAIATAIVPATSWTATAHKPSITGTAVDLSTDFVADCRCWLDYDLTVSGGTATIVLYASGVEVATGSGAVGGAVSFTGDHISGSVTVAADAVTDTGRVFWHYPKAMRVKRNTSNPPSTVVATVAFNKTDGRTWTEPTDLADGTYYYRIQPVNAEGDIGDDSATATKTISAIPAAPTALAYSSGAAGACVVTWTKSTTSGCTYNVYIEQPGTGYMDLSSPVATTLADAETATVAISPTTGLARIVVRAEKAGVEEKNLNALAVKFASGVYVPPTPNTPSIYEAQTNVDLGNVLRTVVNYPTTDEWGAATGINLYKRAQGGSYDYNTPLTTSSVLRTVREGIKQSTLVGSLGADGIYYIVARAVTAAGSESDSSTEVMVTANTVNLTAPAFTAKVSRG